jgi:hypothetical protein
MLVSTRSTIWQQGGVLAWASSQLLASDGQVLELAHDSHAHHSTTIGRAQRL